MGRNDTYWSWSYVDQKFSGAVHVLCTSFAPNWQRASDAILQIIALLPDHFPDQDLFNRTKKLCEAATELGPLMIGSRAYRGSVENTLRRRRRATLEKYANEILAIYHAVQERRGNYVE